MLKKWKFFSSIFTKTGYLRLPHWLPQVEGHQRSPEKNKNMPLGGGGGPHRQISSNRPLNDQNPKTIKKNPLQKQAVTGQQKLRRRIFKEKRSLPFFT